MQATPSLLVDFRLSHVGDQPLYRQVYQRFREAILHGSLPPGTRVPSIRTLACELQLSRSTVEKAYDLLVGEGYLICNGQAGTTIAQVTSLRPPRVATPVVSCVGEQTGALPFGAPRPFLLGTPALDAFPLTTWMTLSQRVTRDRQTMQQVVDPQGHLALRQAISAYLQVSRGVACTASQVFVTSGYRQSLALLTSALLRPRDEVWIEDPAYPPALRLLERADLRTVPVPVDEAGMDVAAGKLLAPHARLALVTPANQSPLGVVLSLSRRGELLTWAASSGAWLVEDDYDSEFCTEGRQQPTLCSLDRAGRAIYLGTFSKALHPALRVAYLVAPPALVPVLQEVCSEVIDGGAVPLHRTLAAFMTEGHFGRHLKRMRGLYASRRQTLVNVLEARLGDRLSVAPWARGMCILAQLKGSTRDVDVVANAAALGLAPSALSVRGVARDSCQGLLVGYANFEDAAAAARAVDLLASCW